MVDTVEQRAWLSTVWGETARLVPSDGAAATRAHLYAVVGKLARDARDGGVGGLMAAQPPPRMKSDDSAAFDAMAEAAAGVVGGVPLPSRAVLWEVSALGIPRTDVLPMPDAARWIMGAGVASGGDFLGPNGRIFRLFESAEPVAKGELPFISALTGTGTAPPARARVGLARIIGSVAVLLFLAGMGLGIWSGRSMSNAYGLMSSNDAGLQARFIDNAETICAQDAQAFPARAVDPICAKLTASGTRYARAPGTRPGPVQWPTGADLGQWFFVPAAACRTTPGADGCSTVWRAAVATDQDTAKSHAVIAIINDTSAWLTGTSGAAGSTSLVTALLVAWLGCGLLVAALGLGTKGIVAGAWVDERNRVSLSRAQLTLWTVVVLGGYAVVVAFDIGLLGTAARDALAATGNWPQGLQVFARIPLTIASALGISVASSGLSALILDTKPVVDVGLATDGDAKPRPTALGTNSSGLDVRASPEGASMADVFMGEENANKGTVDLTRLQNVLITLLLVFGYASFLLDMARDIAPVRIIDALHGVTALLPSLPDPGATFTSLLLVSHGAYLVAKAHDKKPIDAAG